MDFIKSHKLISGLAAILIIFIVGGIILISIVTRINGSKYGDRLKGIENVKIDSSTQSQIESELGNFDKVEKAEYILHGRLINIILHVDKDLKLSKAKEYGKKALEFFKEDELKYYDVQILVVCGEENKTYPAIGYKHKTSKKLYWTNKSTK